MLGGFLEAGDVDVTNAGLDEEGEIHAVAGNLVAHQAELHRLVDAFAQDCDVNGRAFGPFEQVRDIRGAHVVGGLAVNRDDYVPGMNASLVSGRSDEREDYDALVI